MTGSTSHPFEGDWLQATVAQRQQGGWTAITDGGTEIVIPAGVVSGFRSLRGGQRLLVRLGADAVTVEGAKPLPAR